MSESRRITVNGQEFNGPQQFVDGVEWEITEVTGMGDPAAVSTVEQRVAADGTTSTTSYRGARSVGLVGVIRAEDEVRAELARNALRNLITLAEFPITFHEASGDSTVWVKRDQDVNFPSRELPTEFPWAVVLRADDPTIYAGDAAGSGVVTLSTGLPHSSGGLAYPITYPITYTGSAATGDVSTALTAGGHLALRIDGPAVNPSVAVQNSRGLFRLAWLGTLAAGMWIEVDPARREALLQGQAGRPPSVRQWPILAPGVNTFRFRADVFEAAALLTVSIRPRL